MDKIVIFVLSVYAGYFLLKLTIKIVNDNAKITQGKSKYINLRSRKYQKWYLEQQRRELGI